MREAIHADFPSVTTVSGAGIAVVGGLTLTQWLAVGGFALAVAGFFVNLWFKRRMTQLREREVVAIESRTGAV